ncbi:MAG: glycosyl hydrolase-related protein [Tannerella sp.]|jgi:alpha-mannosidase|nr:glycosyl hydrolase-related protein [Tannerella sp.]
MKKRFFIFTVCMLGITFFAGAGEKQKSAEQQPAVKKDTIHVIGHAHMDMNWLWTTSETMKMCQDNLRQAVAFISEYPDYTILQSQAAVYNFVEKADPQLFELVKKCVKEGRLEPVGGEWTEGDANMSSGEAIARSFLQGQRYFQQHFGRMTHVGWLPDNFGHVSQMPQILKLAGCDYFFFARCKPYPGSFWWEGTDGSTVLAYCNDNYNGDINDNIKDGFARFAPGKHRLFHPTGEGDHGGGPYREHIAKIHELDKNPDYPAAVKFTTAEYFFKQLSKEMDGRPTHKGEMQFIFEGCYTTVADTKEGNRNGENALFTSEVFNTLRWLNGDRYPGDEFRDLWRTMTFNQFHDILPGSAIYEANKEAHARYMDVLWKSNDLRDQAFRKIADEIKFKPELGQAVVAFNLQPRKHTAIVEAEVYSHDAPVTINPASWGDYYGDKNIDVRGKEEGKVASILVRDGSGKSYPAQIVSSERTPPGFTSKVRFIAGDIPAGGYKTFYVDASKPGEDNSTVVFNGNTFETDFFKIKVNMETGGISSLIDKRTQKEYVQNGKELNQLHISMEDMAGGMKAWTINRIVGKEYVTNVEGVRLAENGPVRACIETVKKWGKSRFIERTFIYKHYPRIEYELEVHWFETGTPFQDSPMLRAIFPLTYKEDAKFYSQTPFDVVERSQSPSFGGHWGEKNDGQEVPAQKWVDVSDGETGMALLNKSKYGHSWFNGDLRLTLMRAAGEPDIYPNIGKFNIHYALYPHAGDWTNGVWTEGEDFNIPVYAAEAPSLAIGKTHATRPEEASLYTVSAGNVELSGIKRSEDGKMLIVRLVETQGKATETTLNLPVKATSASLLNLIELPLKGAKPLTVKNGALTVSLKPHEIVTLGIKK